MMIAPQSASTARRAGIFSWEPVDTTPTDLIEYIDENCSRQHRKWGRMDLIAQRTKSLEIQQGLFIIRYESADDPAQPPRVLVSTESKSVRLVLPPGADEPVLWSPGACLVVLANRAGRLEVAVSPAQPNGSVGARIKLVPLSVDPAAAREESDVSAEPFDATRIQLLGHVAGVGDKVVRFGEWIAGPASPSRIEGIAIEWPNKPRGVDLRYAVRIGGQIPGATRPIDVGGFAGTRGRAAPLVGATLDIAGPNAGGYQLVADAMFLGAPQMRVAGRHVVLSGPTGREPMVGLRLAIERSDRNGESGGQLVATVPARFGRDLTETRPGSDHIKVVRAQRRPLPAGGQRDGDQAVAADADADAVPGRHRNEVRIFGKRDNESRQLAGRNQRLAERKNLKRVRSAQARKKARPSDNPI
jgi:hypothetical protein